MRDAYTLENICLESYYWGKIICWKHNLLELQLCYNSGTVGYKYTVLTIQKFKII